jgi:hypothetical protein
VQQLPTDFSPPFVSLQSPLLPHTPCLALSIPSPAYTLCTQCYPNISLLCRQEMRKPCLGPFRKSSRVIMAYYLIVRVYLGCHYFHCPLETRKNTSHCPTARSRADHSGLVYTARLRPLSCSVCNASSFMAFMGKLPSVSFEKFLTYCFRPVV